MTLYSFLDDYSEGCHPEILEALNLTNMVQQTAYGNDDYSIEARQLIASECAQPEVAIYFVSGGTLANLIISSAALRSHEAIISADSGHMAMRETGAIEATGHKIITVPGTNGKLDPSDVDAAMAANAQFPHMAKPRMLYISNATEFGTVYTLDELRALRTSCNTHGLLLLIDGARIGVALASSRATDMSLTDIAALADIFWIGGTKSGTLFGEAIVIPNAELATEFDFHLKQRGALLAKGRALGVQFQALFSNGLFERASRVANEGAQQLSTAVAAAGFELAADTESNQVFAILPNDVIAKLQEDFSFYVWEPLADNRSVVRLVTSWASKPEQLELFANRLKAIA